jgi:hypothetical protein
MGWRLLNQAGGGQFALPIVSTMPVALYVLPPGLALHVGVYCWLADRMSNYNRPAAFAS